MRDTSTSTLAQLLFSSPPKMNFAHVVGELDAVLARYPADRRTLSWDCDDVAIFDLDGSRIALGYSEHLPGQHAACLTVSVGHGPQAELAGPLALRRTSLCRKIADRLSTRYPFDEVMWHEIDEPVTPDLIDQMVETLPGYEQGRLPQEPGEDLERLLARMSVELETRQVNPVTNFARPDKQSFAPLSVRPPKAKTTPPVPKPEPVAAEPAAAEPAPVLVANDRPDLPRQHDSDAERIRAALYPAASDAATAADAPSTQMRLAVHAMNATMIVALLPVGAAMMTYSVLRGEDLRLSGRMLALTGLLLAASQSHMGQQVMSFI